MVPGSKTESMGRTGHSLLGFGEGVLHEVLLSAGAHDADDAEGANRRDGAIVRSRHVERNKGPLELV